MFSDKVICAIVVMKTLFECKRDSKGRSMMSVRELSDAVGVSTPLYKRVKSTLLSAGIIEMVSSKIMLSEKAYTTTLISLINIFHGGLFIGEDHNGRRGMRVYRKDEAYAQIRGLEFDLAVELKVRLHSIIVLDSFDLK